MSAYSRKRVFSLTHFGQQFTVYSSPSVFTRKHAARKHIFAKKKKSIYKRDDVKDSCICVFKYKLDCFSYQKSHSLCACVKQQGWKWSKSAVYQLGFNKNELYGHASCALKPRCVVKQLWSTTTVGAALEWVSVTKPDKNQARKWRKECKRRNPTLTWQMEMWLSPVNTLHPSVCAVVPYLMSMFTLSTHLPIFVWARCSPV